MNLRAQNAKVRWLVFAGILFFSCALCYAAIRHGIAEYWAGSSNPDLWLRASKLEPSNPNTWYLLGRYRQLDFEHEDLPLAISYYQQAIALEPIAALYWMDFAGAYEAAGDLDQAEQAYRSAQRDYPISAEVAWRYGNFLLRQNRLDEAFQQIHHAVLEDPKLTPLAVSRCWRGTQDVDRILNVALPAEPDAYWGAIQYFVSANQPDAAMAAWKKLAAEHTSFPLSQAAPLLDTLIQSNHGDDAQTVWKQALSAAGIAPPPGPAGSLIWNGSFEADLLNAGFSWRYAPVQGASLGWDEETVHSGTRSLQITFDGTANLDFAQVWQYVVVEPNTSYRLNAYLQTQELTTDSGVHFEIFDVAQPGIPLAVTPGVLGTQPWTLEDVQFTTGPQTRLLWVRLRRTASNMLSNKIRGTVWVDDVSLVPAAAAEPDKR